MSLINDALKKAERQRAEAEGPFAPLMSGGRKAGRTKGPLSTQNLILIGAGGLVLVVLSVVFTMMLVTGKSGTKPAAKPSPAPIAAAPIAAPLPRTAEANPTVIVMVPAIQPAPAAKPAPAPARTPEPEPVAAVQAALARVETAPRPVQAAPAAPAPMPAAVLEAPRTVPVIVFPHHDDAVQAIVDALQVTGIRSAGENSKVLVGGKILRIHDLVDKASGLRLMQVSTEMLTFVDASGETYLRRF